MPSPSDRWFLLTQGRNGCEGFLQNLLLPIRQATKIPIICIIVSSSKLAVCSCQLTFEMYSVNRMSLTVIMQNWSTQLVPHSLNLWEKEASTAVRQQGQMKELPCTSKAVVRVRETTDHKRHHRSLLAKISDWREDHILLPETKLNRLLQREAFVIKWHKNTQSIIISWHNSSYKPWGGCSFQTILSILAKFSWCLDKSMLPNLRRKALSIFWWDSRFFSDDSTTSMQTAFGYTAN